MDHSPHDHAISRRRLLVSAGALGVAAFAGSSAARASEPNAIRLPFVNGSRPLTSEFPQKSNMILQRSRPPLLETPFEVFDRGVLTPSDRFYVRWHLANIPTSIDPATFRLAIRGHVDKVVNLTLDDLTSKFERFQIVAVNQCSGNGRGYFSPRVPGGEWANGAMGNARWTGVRLKDLLDYAGVRAGAVQVRFSGLETGVIPQTPLFKKSLAIDHARDGEVMVAYLMNDEPLPLLNGYPIRLIVPGWYATYWMKMLKDIEVLNAPDDNFWTAKAYLIPDTPLANVAPGQTGFKLVPISGMVPRSFITNLQDGATIPRARPTLVRGIAFGGLHRLQKVLLSDDKGQSWTEATLGEDYGKYSFRQWQTTVSFPDPGGRTLTVRAVDTTGQMQPTTPNWNGSGFMRNVIESTDVNVT
ncbi:MAG TPA: molybdopterin-dependent oxidoreductase [Xanthobacteraceae bacterium]